MSIPHLFTTSRSFCSWLKQREQRSVPTKVYARFLRFKQLLVHSEPTLPRAVEGLQDVPFRRLFPITLPVPSEGARWWRELWEGEIIDYRHAPCFLGEILCVAKKAIWESLPELYLPVPKHEFRVISEVDAQAMIGAETLTEMRTELIRGLGVAVRHVKT